MNMISTGAFQTEMDASNKQPTVAEEIRSCLGKEKCESSACRWRFTDGTVVREHRLDNDTLTGI